MMQTHSNGRYHAVVYHSVLLDDEQIGVKEQEV